MEEKVYNEYPVLDREGDKNIFICQLVGLGYSLACAEETYEGMRNIIDLYKIPLSSILTRIVSEIDLCTYNANQENLSIIGYNFMMAMVEKLQEITDILKQRIEDTRSC